MVFLKQWIYCVCVSLVLASVFSVFTPKGRLENFYKLLIAIFIFVSFIVPLKDVKLSDVFAFSNDYTISIEEDSADAYENSVNSIIKNLLVKNGIIGADIKSRVIYSSKENTLSVSRVEIAIPDEYDVKLTKELVFNELGIIAEVRHIGE